MEVVAHAARISKDYPPNTVEGIVECVRNGLRYIEVDIAPLATGDFIIFHNEKLDNVTNRKGDVFDLKEESINNIRYSRKIDKKQSQISSLPSVIDLIVKTDEVEELQLDMKVYPTSLFNEKILTRLVNTISPAKDKLRLTSCAEWVLLKLREIDGGLKLGFDPQFYMDFRRKKVNYPPFKKNKFGYYDDHPIAFQNWKSAFDYLKARAEALWNVGLGAGIWYMRYDFLISSLRDGFNWVDFLHERGAKICTWTVDVTEEDVIKRLKVLNDLGVDRVTSNTPLIWKRYL